MNLSFPAPPGGALGIYLGRVLDTIRRAFLNVVTTDRAVGQIILRSPNGTSYTVTVDDVGGLTTSVNKGRTHG